ncbi:MAG TPA: histidine phosphatase family protein [Phototrophicaceae bacterium]|jgi:broad specificity phosphatase PhoE|nr:histidine phosphatase family protein [Phototrophicaceae bacterium]
MGIKTLLLVRHGDYTLSTNFPDHPDGSLTDQGQKQAELVANRLKLLKLDAIHSSPLLRAHETTQIIAAQCPDVPVLIDVRLRECIPVIPPGDEQYFEGIPAEFIARGPTEAAMAFAAYCTPLTSDAPDRIEVIVSHGNLLGYLIARALNAPAEAWVRLDLGNGCISELRIASRGFMKLIKHNDGSHIPEELQS